MYAQVVSAGVTAALVLSELFPACATTQDDKVNTTAKSKGFLVMDVISFCLDRHLR